MTGATKKTEQAMMLRLKDFSEFPGGRYREDGPKSGQEYREDVLMPTLKEHGKITVDLSGVFTVAPSFLDEAFGGLARELGGTKKFRERVSVTADDDPDAIKELDEILNRLRL